MHIFFNALQNSAAVVMVIAGASCDPNLCQAFTHEELARFATDSECPDITVQTSDLDSLAGLERMDRPKGVTLRSNADLVDVTAADGASRMVMQNNPLVRALDLLVHNGVNALESGALEDVTIELDPIVVGIDGESFASVVLGPPLADLRLRCTSSCRAQVSLPGIDRMVIDIEASMTSDLIIRDTIADWTPLQGAGVPGSVTFLGSQTLTVLQEYRAWLDSQGFDGPFELCPIGSNECDAVLAE